MKASTRNIIEPIVFFLALLVLWEILVEIIKVPAFILPPPRDLWISFVNKLPIIGHHAWITFIEAFGGFALSLLLGIGFAVAVVYSRHLQNTIYPLIVILYAMPKSAFAPLMVIWVGYGLVSKIAIAFLVAFFPIVVNTVVGLKEVEPELLELHVSIAVLNSISSKRSAYLIRYLICSPGSKWLSYFRSLARSSPSSSPPTKVWAI